MNDTPDIAAIAVLIGDPTRARMLTMLMDGRAFTATELAFGSRVAPSTASGHLARLEDAGLLTVTKQGRHRYFRLSNAEVAAAIESLSNLAVRGKAPALRTGPRDADLRRARVCYDHLAGEAAVQLYGRLRDLSFLSGHEEALVLTARGEKWCDWIGIDLESLRGGRRVLCRSCLDWSERRMHLAGAVGAAMFDRLLALRYVRREAAGRAVVLSARGKAFIADPDRIAGR